MAGSAVVPKFISDEDMASIEASEPKKGFVSDDDMSALEAFHAKPGFVDKIKSIPGSLLQAGKTLINTPKDLRKAYDSPGQAVDVAARGLAGGASWLTIPEPLKLEGEKAIARNLPEALGGMSDEEYKNSYGNRDEQDLINQNIIHENTLRSKFPAVDLVSRGTGFVAGNNPLSMIAKTATQSTSKALGEGDSIPNALLEGGQDALIQSALTYGPQAIAKIPNALNRLSRGLSSSAESLAENATGATAVQAEKFRPGAGRELLDRGIVKFFDKPEDVAVRALGEMDNAQAVIDESLKSLDAKGVTASVDNVVSALESKIADLKQSAGNEGTIAQLEKSIENLVGRGKSEMPISLAEQSKKNYARSVNYASPVADQDAAFHNASAFRNEVERSAEAADPAVSKSFESAKDTYGLLAPIEKAAYRRGIQQGQHPYGGLGDMVAAGVGGAPGVIAKRAIFPRISSSLAVSSDWLAKKIQTNPQALGKYGPVLQNAATRGGNALGVTHYLLQSTDPEYQKLMQESQEQDDAEQ
jgi:hypothetical protein